jgi:hypothetical protein
VLKEGAWYDLEPAKKKKSKDKDGATHQAGAYGMIKLSYQIHLGFQSFQVQKKIPLSRSPPNLFF